MRTLLSRCIALLLCFFAAAGGMVYMLLHSWVIPPGGLFYTLGVGWVLLVLAGGVLALFRSGAASWLLIALAGAAAAHVGIETWIRSRTELRDVQSIVAVFGFLAGITAGPLFVAVPLLLRVKAAGARDQAREHKL